MHLAMADEAYGNENFFWDNQPWIISDNSGGDVGIDVLVGTVSGEDQDKGKKVLDSSTTNSPNQLGGDVAVPVEAIIGKKRSVPDSGGGGNSSKKASGSSGGNGGEGKGGGESDHEIHIWTERERRKKMRNMFSSLHALLPQLPPKADKSTIVDEAVSYIRTLQQTLQKLQKQKLERLHGMSAMTNFVDPSRLLTQQKLSPLMDTMTTRESFMADQGSSSSNLAAVTMMNSANPFPTATSFSNIPARLIPTMVFHTWSSPNVVLNVCGEDAQLSVCSFKKHGMLSMIIYILDRHKLEVVSAHVFSDNLRNMFMLQARGNYIDYKLPEGFLIEEAFKQAAAEIMLWVTS